MKTLELSVHQLVDFVLRRGSLDTRTFNSMTMQEGTKIHNIYQLKQGSNYVKEYPLSGFFQYEDNLIRLSGRADGIILDEVPIIEEIKSTNTDLDKFYKENEEWHLGQAICYAYLYSREKKLNNIAVRLTYISQIDNSIKKHDFDYNIDDLSEKIHSYFDVYFQFERILDVLRDKRNTSLNEISFPFGEIRPGQKDLIDFTSETIDKVEMNFAEASTGIGKTIATIFATLPYIKSGKIDKVFYLCPKNTNFENSKKALTILQDYGYKLSFVELRAKSKMCPYKLEKNCNPSDCPLTVNYYTKLKDALMEALKKYDSFNSETIKEVAKKFEICPFEFSLELSLYSDFIICDYNYAFHPIAYLRRFLDAPDKVYHLFALVDEAHNLIDRARDMFTISFTENGYKIIKNDLKNHKTPRLKKIIRQINQDLRLFNEFDFTNGPIILETLDNMFISHLENFRNEISVIEAENPNLKLIKAHDCLIDLYKFLTIYGLLNDGFKIILSKNIENLDIKLFCIDPSEFIKKTLLKFLGTLFFSATLTPIDYFENVILNRNNEKHISLPSPFDPNNFLLIINDKISIKYKDREKTLPEVAKEILDFISYKTGNYLIFVPSFEYSKMLKKYVLNDERFIFQTSEMTDIEKTKFLDEFTSSPKESKVGVCAISGSFAESIDLVGDRLIGVVIVGVGLPQVNFENNLIKDFYTAKDMNGYDFAYLNPGLNKVLQAIGRVIRTENDKGAALIIDNRYKQTNYRVVLDKHFKNQVKISNSNELIETLNSFYKK